MTLCTCGVLLCREQHPYRVQCHFKHQVVADETFDSRAKAQAFQQWWMRQDDLPKAVMVQAREDVDGVRWHEPSPGALPYTMIPDVRARFTAACAADTHALDDRFDELMAFALGPRPE